MAEALLNRLDAEHFEAMSAGIDRGETPPVVVEVMKEVGIDLAERTPKTVQCLLGQPFNFVITMTDRTKSECPKFAGAEFVHWRFDEDVIPTDQTREKRFFEAVRDQITLRLRLFTLVQLRSTVPGAPSAASAASGGLFR